MNSYDLNRLFYVFDHFLEKGVWKIKLFKLHLEQFFFLVFKFSGVWKDVFEIVLFQMVEIQIFG